MIKRTIYIANPAYLSTNNKQLVITKPDDGQSIVPIEDIGFLILDHPQLTLTHSLIRSLQENNVLIMSCDEKHMPYSYMVPIVGHSEQMKYQRIQVDISKPLKNNLWKQCVSAKIENQAMVLHKLGDSLNSRKLKLLADRVTSGDKTNVEGYAASVYWKILLHGQGRDRYGDPPNNYFNYGYTVLRGMVARALVGAGLLPTIGIHHKNKYNPFCLADDMMEAFRPFVDLMIIDLLSEKDQLERFLSIDSRSKILGIATMGGMFGKKKRPLMVGMEETMASLRKCYSGERIKIILPKIQ